MEAAPLARDSVLLWGWEGSPPHRVHLWTAFLPPEVGLCIASTFQTENSASLLKPIRTGERQVLCYEPQASTK